MIATWDEIYPVYYSKNTYFGAHMLPMLWFFDSYSSICICSTLYLNIFRVDTDAFCVGPDSACWRFRNEHEESMPGIFAAISGAPPCIFVCVFFELETF